MIPKTSNAKIGPADPRYADLVAKRFNKRFASQPDYLRLPASTEELSEALEEAVRDGLRVAARSGGHCLEGFVSNPEVRAILDTSLLTGLRFDPKMNAFELEAGLTLGEAYRKLYLGWGVTIPAGESPDVGVGGHMLGGAFGFLCREHGLAVDHLYAVEVVTVDSAGRAQAVIATREPSDPNRDLWWAHTGGGGGNFGIVTRYWFRSPQASGSDAALLLPKAPPEVVTFKAEWDWGQVGEEGFAALVRNYGAWCERNQTAGTPATKLFSVLMLVRPPHGKLTLRGLVTVGAESERILDEHLAALSAHVGVRPTREVARMSWLGFALNPFPDLFAIGPGGVTASRALFKIKDAFLRKPHSDRQIAVMFDYLTRRSPEVAGGAIGFATYGGQVNTVAPDATASAQREAIMTTAYTVGWVDPGEEAGSLAWVRELYRDLFAESGGVPVPGQVADGALINHPDSDLADPAWNRSGVGFGAIYYKGNYARLREIKRRWDPRHVFRHQLSIEP
jgi:hypothetical protein